MASILWSAPVSPAAKHPHNMMLPPCASRLGWCSSAYKPPPFSSKHNDGHYGQQFYFCFIRPEDNSAKSTICAVANRGLAFLWWFWSSGFFLAERPFRLCRFRTRFTVDIETFVPVSSSISTRSFAVVLGLICTFRNKVCSSLGDRTRLLPERYDGWVVPWCLYLRAIACTDERGTFRRLEIAPKDEPDLWRSTIFLRSWLIYLDFVKQRGTEFEGRAWNTSTGTPPID